MAVTAHFTWVKSVSANVLGQTLTVDGVANELAADAEAFDLVVDVAGHHVADLTCRNDHATSAAVHVEFDTPDVSVPEAPTALAVNVEVA